MVTSPHSLASAAGLDVLRAGGSAIDAAIAASAVLAVVYPHMTGLGGDAFWLIHNGGRGEMKSLHGGGTGPPRAPPPLLPAGAGGANPPGAGPPANLTVPGAGAGAG